MELNISILEIKKVSASTSGGKPYTKLEIAYKDLGKGSLASKVIMPFGTTQPAHKALFDAKTGDVFTVTSIKNEQSGYWDWTNATQTPPGETPVATPQAKGNAAPKSNYETPEERAKRQVYIVKQSSLSNAVALLSCGAKTPPSKSDVFDLAQEFTNWVFSEPKVSLAEMPNDIQFEDVQ